MDGFFALSEGAFVRGGVKAWRVGQTPPPTTNAIRKTYSARLPFLPTDAVSLGDGSLLVLERSYIPVVGNSFRLMHVSAHDLHKDVSPLKGREIIRFNPSDKHRQYGRSRGV